MLATSGEDNTPLQGIGGKRTGQQGSLATLGSGIWGWGLRLVCCQQLLDQLFALGEHFVNT